MEAPGGGEDFERGGWSFEFDQGEDGAKFKLDETLDAEAMLLGRVTYERFAWFWPSQEGEFADKLNTMPKYAHYALLLASPRGLEIFAPHVPDSRAVSSRV